MPNHLHVYTGKGRCIRSAPLRGDLDRMHAGAPIAVLNALLDLGFTASEWNVAENAGLAKLHGETHIVRVKPDGTQRDMRPGGAAMAIADIQRGGTEVSREDAWLFPR